MENLFFNKGSRRITDFNSYALMLMVEWLKVPLQ